mmetsp:Transcript_28574/g.72372  ORF Transcript_28574/g.72372 Transcript_28574/m.72372 type:complete len:212 (+) Transcript_28574:2173-2808(+)
MIVVGQGLEALHIRLKANDTLLRLRVRKLENLDLGHGPHDLIKHLLALAPVVLLLLHDRDHILVELLDSRIPVLGLLSQVLQGPDGCHQQVAVAKKHDVFRHVGDALGVCPSTFWQKSDRTWHDRLDFLGHDAQLPLGEELVVELILSVVELPNAKLLQLTHENRKVGIADVLLDLVIREICLIHAGGALQQPVAPGWAETHEPHDGCKHG